MTAQELKNSILQLAVQGKLVPQCKDDELASELLKRIKQEKSALIKAGKIKKYKVLSELSVDDCPFDIPESWIWVKLGYICQFLDGVKICEKEYPYLEAKYLRGKADATILNEGKFVEKGTRLILVDGENSGEVFNATEDGYMGSTFKVLFFPRALFERYVLNFLLLKRSAFRNNKTGSAIPHLNKELFFNMPFPIPPLAEQKRIVEKIEELMPLIEEYGKAEEQLSKLNAEFPDKLRKSILQQAVQGKLTERDPADEPASELIKRIKAEKEALIKSGKIKKEKPLPAITDDEKPFDIPDTWEWVRLGAVIDIMSGFAFRSTDFKQAGKHRLLRGVNLSVGNTRWDDTVYVDEIPENLNVYQIHRGDVLIGLDRPWISDGIRVAIFDEDEDTYLVQRVLRVRETSAITQDYIALLLRSSLFRNSVERETTGISVPHISPGQVCAVAIPLPPLAEQKRIVKRVEELLSLCDGLK